MTVSIKKVLATLPSGAPGAELSDEELGAYLGKYCNRSEDIERNTRHALRDELYRDGGCAHMCSIIDKVFADPKVRELRKAWVKYARFNNPLKRIVNEISTVYAEPAKRHVAGDADNVKYQALLEAVCVDEVFLQMSRLLNLHRALLIGFRCRQLAEDVTNVDGTTLLGDREAVIEIATPATVRAVTHPNDNKLVVGWLVRAENRTARDQLDAPAWTLWTDHESVFLRADLKVVTGSYIEHKLGVCPWVPISLGAPYAGFWPGEEGEDLVAAHIAIWMTNILLLKESKSATKQTVLQGDTTNMARDQAADSEVPIEAPDGTSVSAIDMSMDLTAFQKTADHVLDNVAMNYGMTPALVSHQGTQSAEARDLMRIPLRELRKQQQTPWRRFEKRFWLVVSIVMKHDMPEESFNPDGWRQDFGEAQTPLSKGDEMDLFLAARTAGVDDTVEFVMRQFPGMTYEEAEQKIKDHIFVETWRNQLMRPLMQMSGSPGQPLAVPGAGDGPRKLDDPAMFGGATPTPPAVPLQPAPGPPPTAKVVEPPAPADDA